MNRKGLIFKNLNYTCESAVVDGTEIHYTNCNQYMIENSKYEVFLVDDYNELLTTVHTKCYNVCIDVKKEVSI